MGKSFEKWNFARHFGEKNNHTFKFKYWTPLLKDFPSCKPTFFRSYFTSFLWYGTSETLKVSLDSKAKLEQPRVQLRSPGRPRQSRSLSALHYPALLHYLLYQKLLLSSLKKVPKTPKCPHLAKSMTHFLWLFPNNCLLLKLCVLTNFSRTFEIRNKFDVVTS